MLVILCACVSLFVFLIQSFFFNSFPGRERLPGGEHRVRDDRLHREQFQVLGGAPGDKTLAIAIATATRVKLLILYYTVLVLLIVLVLVYISPIVMVQYRVSCRNNCN